jgi:hypothetical protein
MLGDSSVIRSLYYIFAMCVISPMELERERRERKATIELERPMH